MFVRQRAGGPNGEEDHRQIAYRAGVSVGQTLLPLGAGEWQDAPPGIFCSHKHEEDLVHIPPPHWPLAVGCSVSNTPPPLQ